jgi:hypothetical protein
MTRLIKSSAVVVTALWVGVLFCLGFVVAPYVFILAARRSPSVPNSGVAADLIGPLLYSADVIGLFVGVCLVGALVYLRRRGEVPMASKMYLSEAGVTIAMICAAINYFIFTPRLKILQGQLSARYGAFHLADKADALFQRFDSLHQTSTTLFMVGFAAALVCLVCLTQFRTGRAGERAATT